MAKTVKLSQLAGTIRSKNGKVSLITFDIIFPDKTTYEMVKRSGVLTKKKVAELYGVKEERITDFVEFDPGNAIKFTMYRSLASGSPGDTDILGAQQYIPLLDVEVPVES